MWNERGLDGSERRKEEQYSSWIHLVILSFIFSFSQVLSAQNLQRFEYVEPKIGTSVQLIFYANNQTLADSIAQIAYQKIDTLNQIFSDYLLDSEVNQFSKQAGSGEWVKLSNDLWTVLSFGQCISKQSKGMFDMTIAPLSKLWRKAFRQQKFPKKEKIKTAKKLVNYKYLELNEATQSARLKKKGMRLDLGGIAKGYIVDKTVEFLQSIGLKSVLVDAGGDLRITASPPDQKGWKIQQNASMLYLQHMAIATSGSAYQYLEWKGKRYSHIIHPKKGIGVTNPATVSVQAETCMTADVWASILSGVVEREQKRFLRKNKQILAVSRF